MSHKSIPDGIDALSKEGLKGFKAFAVVIVKEDFDSEGDIAKLVKIASQREDTQLEIHTPVSDFLVKMIRIVKKKCTFTNNVVV